MHREPVGEMMALTPQIIPINFGQGIDSKTDPKLVVAGKMLRLENAIFTQSKQIAKRNGYDLIPSTIIGGGTLSAPKLLKALGNDLVCADNGNLYSYSPGALGWKNVGAFIPVAATTGAITSGIVSQTNESYSANQYFQTQATNGLYTLYAWSQIGVLDAPDTFYTIKDAVTGATIVADTTVGSGAVTSVYSAPKAVCLSGTTLAIYSCVKNGATIDLMEYSFTISSSGVSVSSRVFMAALPLGATYAPTGARSGTVTVYDAIGVSNGAAVAAATSTGISLSIAGNSATITTTTPTVIHLCADPSNGNVWVFWATASTLKYAVFSSTASVVLAATSVTTILSNFEQLSAYKVSSTQFGLFYSQTSSISLTSATLNSTGTGNTSDNFLNSPGVLCSRIFVINSRPYAAFQNISSFSQNVTFIAALYPENVAQSYLAVSQSLRGVSSNTRSAPGNLFTSVAVSSSKVTLFVPYALTNNTVGGATTQLLGSKVLTLDWSAADINQGVTANNVLLLNGGIQWLYDGNSVYESGFLLTPDVSGISASGSASGLSAGRYIYFAVYEWTDAKGNFHQSGASVAGSITVTAGQNVTVSINSVITTNRLNFAPSVSIYRSAVNSNFCTLLVRGIQASSGRPGGSFNYVDSASDASIASNNSLYTNGSVIGNGTPPPALAYVKHNNRILAIDSENPNTIWYSKTLQPGVGVSWSPLLTVQFDAKGGKGVALASLDSNLVIGTENQPFVLSGDGASDTGSGSTFGNAQAIPSDVGFVGSKGVITMPDGVLFKTLKGIYLLDRSFSLKYFGAEVEAYNSQNITSAVIIATKNQVRFLTDSGLTLVYDYAFRQWSTFTNHQGYAADIWQGAYTYVRTDGTVYQEHVSKYLDNTTAFNVLAQTAYLALGSVQGFQRVRRLALLGTYANGASGSHSIQVSAAYDFGPTFSTPIPYTFGASSTSGVVQYRERLPIQKCDTLSLLIQEVSTGDSAENLTLTDLSLEAGMKSGLNRLSSGRSVG